MFTMKCIVKFLDAKANISRVIMYYGECMCNPMDVFYFVLHVPEIQAILKLGTRSIFGPMLFQS